MKWLGYLKVASATTLNILLNAATFDGGGMFAFNRQKMLVGDPTANFIYFNRNLASFPEGQAGMLPADMDGVKPPPPGAPCPFAYFTVSSISTQTLRLRRTRPSSRGRRARLCQAAVFPSRLLTRCLRPDETMCHSLRQPVIRRHD